MANMIFAILFKKVLVFMWSVWRFFEKLLAIGNRYWYQSRLERTVPPIADPLLLMSATALAAGIRTTKIKCEDVIKSYIARIREVNPYINAVCHDRFEESLDEARKVDQLVASRVKSPEELQNEKPLLGIPFTVKILIGVKGMPCNGASLLHRDVVAREDADAVALLKDAGAICLAVTNSPEFGLNFETHNILYGRTSNPYDTSRTSGGSSGGEGALIGAGGSLIGIGNDLGGSIRHPCNFNGVFGHKATAGLVSNHGLYPYLTPKADEYMATGPICRYAEDLVLAMRVLSSAKMTPSTTGDRVDFSKKKLYYMLGDNNPFAPAVTSEVKNALMKAVYHFQSVYNTEVKLVNIKGMRAAIMLFCYFLNHSMAGKTGDFISAGKFHVNPTTELQKVIFRRSKLSCITVFIWNVCRLISAFGAKKYFEMSRALQRLEEQFNAILDDNSVLFLPSFNSTAHHHNRFFPLIFGVSMMAIFNILGLPVTQCPVGLSGDKLPLGFQVVGAKGQDPLTMAFAVEIEKAFDGWVPPNNPK